MAKTAAIWIEFKSKATNLAGKTLNLICSKAVANIASCFLPIRPYKETMVGAAAICEFVVYATLLKLILHLFLNIFS